VARGLRVVAASSTMRRVGGGASGVDEKKGTGERGKMERRSVAFESTQGGMVERRRGRQGVGRCMESTINGGPGSDRRGTARAARQQPTATRPQRARATRRVRTVGRCHVTDEWGLAGSGSSRARGTCGAWVDPGKKWGGPSPDEQ
jgi:hypothetical protein